MWVSVRREGGKWHLVQRVLGVAVWRWSGESWSECCIVLGERFENFKTAEAMRQGESG